MHKLHFLAAFALAGLILVGVADASAADLAGHVLHHGLSLHPIVAMGVLGGIAPASIRPIVPRGLIGRPRAEAAPSLAEIKAAMDLLGQTFADFRRANDEALKSKADAVLAEKVDRANAAVTEALASVDGLAKKLAAMQLNGGGNPAAGGRNRAYNADQMAYFAAVDGYFRGSVDEREIRALQLKAGFAPVQAAMQTQSSPDGGFLTRPELDNQIDSVLKLVSPIRSLATVRQIGAYAFSKLVNQHGTASGWVGETDSRIQTQAAQLSELTFPAMEIYAMPAATQTLLDDSFVDLEAWLADEVSLEFAQKEGAAFVAGDGNKKPWGFLAYPTVADSTYAWGSIGYIGTGNSGAFASTAPADAIVDLYHALRVPYRNNGTFVANNKTLGALRKQKDGQGNYLININFKTDGVVTEMMGRPVVEVPDMPDMAANSLSLAFGDFQRGYVVVDRIGVRVLRDPFTAKPYVLFYTTKRVGGGVQNFEAIKLLKFA